MNGVHALLTLSTVPRTQQRVLADTVDTDGDEPNACEDPHVNLLYMSRSHACICMRRVVSCRACGRGSVAVSPESALVCYILLVLSTNICLPGLRAPAARRAQRPCQPALSFHYMLTYSCARQRKPMQTAPASQLHTILERLALETASASRRYVSSVPASMSRLA